MRRRTTPDPARRVPLRRMTRGQMSSCKHPCLLLLQPQPRKRCRHCGLTIRSDELAGGYCPECYAANGVKRYDFADDRALGRPHPGYRCEVCGTLIS